jgi:putative effector of murein hydrolase
VGSSAIPNQTSQRGVEKCLGIVGVQAAAHPNFQRFRRWCVVRQKIPGAPPANPVLIAILIVSVLLKAAGTPMPAASPAPQFIRFLLGPATVALAAALTLNLNHVRRSFPGVGLALLAGSLTSALSGHCRRCLGLAGGRAVALSMAPKTVTTPIALTLSQEIGGVPSPTAALAIAGGIIAAIVGKPMLHWLRVNDWRAHGLRPA